MAGFGAGCMDVVVQGSWLSWFRGSWLFRIYGPGFMADRLYDRAVDNGVEVEGGIDEHSFLVRQLLLLVVRLRIESRQA